MKRTLEKEIQHSIIEWLEYKKYVVVKFSSVGIFNKRTGSYIPQRQKGVSDILACQPKTGRFVAIEVKRKGNKPSPEQLLFIESIKKIGGIGFVAYSINDVESMLTRGSIDK